MIWQRGQLLRTLQKREPGVCRARELSSGFCTGTGSRESRVEKLAGSNHNLPVVVKSLSTSLSQMTSLRLSSLEA